MTTLPYVFSELKSTLNYISSGVSKDGLIRHFFHRPSKAYTTGTRKRRKEHSDHKDGSETCWHKTGKTRPVYNNSMLNMSIGILFVPMLGTD